MRFKSFLSAYFKIVASIGWNRLQRIVGRSSGNITNSTITSGMPSVNFSIHKCSPERVAEDEEEQMQCISPKRSKLEKRYAKQMWQMQNIL